MAQTSLMIRCTSSDAGYGRAFLIAALIAAAILSWVRFDRRAPVIFLDTRIAQQPVHIGSNVTVERTLDWIRNCRGEAQTEIVNPKGYVTKREPWNPIIPANLGRQTVSSTWPLPSDMLGPGEAMGTAVYRGSITFHDCGVTSWFVPIVVQYRVVTFEVWR